MSASPTSALLAWPKPPTPQPLTPAQLAPKMAKLQQQKVPILGLWVQPPLELDTAHKLPRLWLTYSQGQHERAIYEIRASSWSDLEPLAQALQDPNAPYLIYLHAQAALACLAPAHLPPHKLGCLRSAASLLGRASGHDDLLHASVAELAAKLLQRRLGAAPEQQADALIPLYRRMAVMMRELGLVASYKLECELAPAVVAMQRAGMPLDGSAYERVASGWSSERKQCEDPARAKRLDKLLSTYRFWALDHLDPDERIRCQLDPLATESGRFSCSAPNLQQVPSEHTAPGLRACFRAPEGHCLIIADYAQIELRVAAHLAGCRALAQVFVQGQDPHLNTAASLAQKRPEQVTPAERKLAKAINFGFLFGMGHRRFASYAKQSYGIDLSESEAKAAKDAFFRAYPGIAAWHRQTSALGQDSTQPVIVKTQLGRTKRFAPGQFRFNAALNIPVQGTAAEGFKRAMLRLHRELPKLGAMGVLCIHDEYIAQAPQGQAQAALDLVVQVMQDEMHKLVPSVPIRAQGTIAKAWS